jgi:Copper transport outer membrane protein, MctB
VIDFRYHLVSIVAVFLALAIGIVLGSTELQGNTYAVLNSTSNSLRSQLNAAQAEREGYKTQASTQDQFLQSAEPRLLGKLLAGDNVVIVTEPGAQSSVVNGIEQAAGMAGATVTGQVALQPKFNDISGTNQSSLSSINSSIAGTDGTVLAQGTDPQTLYQQQAAQLIATAILDKTTGQTGQTGQTGLTAAAAQTLLNTYEQAGYLIATGSPTKRATLAVLVTPQTAPTDGAADPANQALLAVAQEFASLSAATLVAGGTTGSAQSGNAMSVLRSSSVSGQVSSVDNADTTLGQISAIEALAAQLAGGKPNSYGISGASAISPVPLPSPSPTATVTPTPHPTATGKGGKQSVKKT